MKQILITLAWVVAALAVVSVPIISVGLFIASASVLIGLSVGFTFSSFFVRYTVFEESLGWLIGFCVMVVSAFYLVNYLI